MLRLTSLLGKLSRMGKIVSLLHYLQKIRNGIGSGSAPALKGREFPVNMPGFFDLIGLVETRTKRRGKIIYPPRVRFRSPDDSFLAKCQG